jgi:2-methylcitrate dehydratase PrpD
MNKRLISDVLAEFVLNTQPQRMPADVQHWAKLLILDAIGNAYASSSHDFAQRALSALQGLGEGDSCVIGSDARLALRDAVMMNGTLIHGLDYDDTYLPGATHLGASCFPTALGLAAQRDASGADFLAAYALGLEAGTRLGGASKGAFLKGGFHPTSLLGIFASTLTAGRLTQLTHAQLVMAQGIALSWASGNMQPTQEGTWAKRLHAGLAGAGAINAVAMAKNDFTGPFEVYEGRYGLFPCFLGTHAGEADLPFITRDLGEHWELMRTSVKLFPACYQSHAFMNAALALRKEESIDVDAIESINTLIAETAVPLVCEPLAAKHKPHNSYAASFSLPYAVACCLSRGRFGLEETEEAAFTDPALLKLARKVSYEIDPNSGFPKYRSGEVIVRLRDGREFSRRKNILPDDRAPEADVVRKFRDNTRDALSPERVSSIIDMILNVESVASARTIALALTAGGS